MNHPLLGMETLFLFPKSTTDGSFLSDCTFWAQAGHIRVYKKCSLIKMNHRYIIDHRGVTSNQILGGPRWVKNALQANQWPLVSVSHPWRASWADTVPFKGPPLALCVASGTSENQWHCQVCHARREGPRTPSRTIDGNLDSAFVDSENWRGLLIPAS